MKRIKSNRGQDNYGNGEMNTSPAVSPSRPFLPDNRLIKSSLANNRHNNPSPRHCLVTTPSETFLPSPTRFPRFHLLRNLSSPLNTNPLSPHMDNPRPDTTTMGTHRHRV